MTPYPIANIETTCDTALMGASNTLDSSGSIGSQIRCTDMLEKVARDNNKIARLVAGESSWSREDVLAEFKTIELYYAQTDKNAKNIKFTK
jgi:hypothetical protein